MSLTSPSSASPREGASAFAYDRVNFDNLLRRELKITDPSDAKQVAAALLARYRGDPRAQAIEQEAKGLPFLQTIQAAPAPQLAYTSSDAEWQQALDDVERDFQELLTNTALKDITPEISGWSRSVRAALGEGTVAARFGLDPAQRDKTFGIRAQLRDYARIARLLGALTPTVMGEYRQLARSLDEASAVLLVKLGESLANAGFGGGRFLLQTPYTELQTRRDAVIYALRNLVGATQEAYGPNEFPRGLHAYRELYRNLEEQGQADLRSLLSEGELTRAMDELIQRVGDGTPEGLRAIGATAQLDLGRFRRLVLIGWQLSKPSSPSLNAFLQALQLFIDAFTSSGGFRLLRIARPQVLQYGLYGANSRQADRRLSRLVQYRIELAEANDCLSDCSCDSAERRAIIVLDKALHSIDVAIDLYSLGTKDFDTPECRASAHGFLLQAALAFEPDETPLGDLERYARAASVVAEASETLNAEPRQNGVFAPKWVSVRLAELAEQRSLEEGWLSLVGAMTQGCTDAESLFGKSGLFAELTDQARRYFTNESLPPTQLVLELPPHADYSLAVFSNQEDPARSQP